MFEVVIVSPVFEGKRLLARHKLVNEALKEEISKVHAFTQVSPMDAMVGMTHWLTGLTFVEIIHTRGMGEEEGRVEG